MQRPRFGPLVAAAAALLLHASSCAAFRGAPVVPVPPRASSLLAEARARARATPDETEAVRTLALRALEAAPDWVAPRRMLDDLERDALRAPEALGRRLAELAERPDDAALRYLVGRLEGEEGARRFEEARRLDPDLAWPHHGLAWMRFLAGDLRAARRHGLRALARARDAWEHAYFAQAQGRYLAGAGRTEEAVALLEAVRADADLTPADDVDLRVRLAAIELSAEDPLLVERGLHRAVELLVRDEVLDAEVRELFLPLLSSAASLGGGASADVEAALGSRRSPQRDRLRADLYLQRGADELALGLLEELREEGVAAPLVSDRERAAHLAAGAAREALEAWLAGLPAFARADDGLPHEPRLRALVLAARGVDEPGGGPRLGRALLEAGWFREARGHAAALAGRDLEAALAVDARAAAGLALLGEVERVLRGIDLGVLYGRPWPRPAGEPEAASRPRPLGSLDELLDALQPHFAGFLGEDLDELGGSPRLSFGPLAEVVHPGPLFAERDERAGRGTRGAPVPGLARALATIGRFGIFGRALGGGGPDGTILRRLHVEERAGEHLGVAFEGTIAWCEGTDVPSRPVRRGARITGAALHEGYWVDVDGVRADHEHWRALERTHLGPEAPEGTAVLDALRAARGPRLPASAPAFERRRVYAPAGVADRVRLAVLLERAASAVPEGSAPLVRLEELLETTAIHEEGHLCDRARYLPLSHHPLRALALLLRSGLTPGGVARMLEYRAQLVALCESPEPRIPLAECLEAVQSGQRSTAHASAYAELLEDVLAVLDERVAELTALDPEHYLLHQLHHLGGEELRGAALELARREGMLER